MERLKRSLGYAIGGLLLAVLGWWALGRVPPPLLVNRANGSYAVTDRDGRLLRLGLTGDEQYRLWTPLEEIPAALRDSTLRYEDRGFYRHPGVNPLALARAAWSSLVVRERWIGGSTLTMQLARQRFRLKTRSLAGKLRQIGYALWLERHFSKREILEAYLNLAPYGANIQGIGAAAWVYFRKPAAALSEEESRALALIPQNPRLRAPASARGKDTLRRAWRTAYGADPAFDRLWFRNRDELPLRAPHFAERVHELNPELPSPGTTLEADLQELTQEILAGYVRRQQPKGIANATALLVHGPGMEVRAYVGSADYRNPGIRGYVNGLKARRSPGSALKPFIYALALNQGLITPDTLLKDTPLRVGEYEPENFEGDFYGPLSATEALVRSRNIPAVALLAQLREPTLYRFLQRAGLRLPREEAFYGLTLAMGGAEVSMEELLALYGTIANAGEFRELRWLKQPRKPAEALRLLSPEAAFLVRKMLETNPPPQRAFGGRSFAGTASPVAWKTGTSSGLKDAWAVGLMGDWLVGTWVGNFDGAPNRYLVGRDMAGPLLFALLDALRLERPVSPPPSPPPGLKAVEICPLSGALRSPWCPHGKTGWIIPGVSPLASCAVHREIHVDAAGLRLCRGDESHGRVKVAEFWDHDVLEAFRLAGIRRDTPPPFVRPCEDLAGSDTGLHPPAILSPQPHLTYPLRAAGGTLQFSASGGGGRRLYWFVDDTFVGEGSSVPWTGKPGRFIVRVVDDQGQSAATPMTVLPGE